MTKVMKSRNILIALVALLFASCAKDEVSFYSGEDGITFYLDANEKDSTAYSFAMNLQTLELDTIPVKMRIQGYVSNVDRKVKVVAAEGTTATEGVDFVLPEVVVPAGASTIVYPLIVKNTPIMRDKSLRIVMKVSDSEDFKVGTLGREIGNTVSISTYKVDVSNIILDNARWDEKSDQFKYFGKYSYEKYRFMVTVLGVTDFTSAAIGFYGMYNYPIILRQKLAEHEAQYGPIYVKVNGVETSEKVTF
jgi:hypothetical protein